MSVASSKSKSKRRGKWWCTQLWDNADGEGDVHVHGMDTCGPKCAKIWTLYGSHLAK
jgi:hypothetical protein